MYDWHIWNLKSLRGICRSYDRSNNRLDYRYMLTRSYSILVIVKPLARLLSDPARVDHTNQQPSRSILAIASFIVQNSLDAQTRIQADQVGKRKWTHGMTHSESESCIDILGCCNSLHRQFWSECRQENLRYLFKNKDGFVEHGHEDSIGDETWRIR
jgi:hypothetical protein